MYLYIQAVSIRKGERSEPAYPPNKGIPISIEIAKGPKGGACVPRVREVGEADDLPAQYPID